MSVNYCLEFKQIRVVLVGITHPGNIGACARAMLNMNLSQLVLVQPKQFPHYEATVRAAGADQILANALVVDDLHSAIIDCGLVIGSSARKRALAWPVLDPRECAQKILIAAKKQTVALVFGREHSGLTNEELALCHYHVQIPTNPDFASLNLAMAVQVIVYELVMASRISKSVTTDAFETLANQAQLEGFYQHLENVLVKLDFIQAGKEKTLMLRLRRLFARTQLEETEINILRGILSAVEKK